MKYANIFYLIEAKRYTLNQLTQEIGLTAQQLRALPDRVIESKSDAFIIRFVGIIAVGGQLIVVLPKYFADRKTDEWKLSGQTIQEESRLILRVLKAYNKNQQGNLAMSEDGGKAFNAEPLTAINLVEHFREYGYWYKTEFILTNNQIGETDWQRTIENAVPIITDDCIIYPETYSYQRRSHSNSIILQIQRWAIRYCVEKYYNIFQDFEGIQYDSEAVSDCNEIGDTNYLISILEHELRISYRDNDVELLRLLIQLLNDQAEEVESSIQLFGTTAFHEVWEAVCKTAFGDQADKFNKLIKIPEWHRNDEAVFSNEKNRLIPDIICLSERHLLIADAKYYNLHFSTGQVINNPGIADITKQIVYQAVVSKLPGISSDIVLNAFIFPRSDIHGKALTQSDWLWGWIDSKIPILKNSYIAVLLVPPHDLYRYYLENEAIVTQQQLISDIVERLPHSLAD